jgi:hypothetical protein
MDIQVIPHRHESPRHMIQELYAARNLTADETSVKRWLGFYDCYGMTDLVNALNGWLNMSDMSLQELSRMETSLNMIQS